MKKATTVLTSIIAAFTAVLTGTLIYFSAMSIEMFDLFGKSLHAPLVQNTCQNYVEFVLDRSEAGMSAETIDELWNEHIARRVESDERSNTGIACGTVEDVLSTAGLK